MPSMKLPHATHFKQARIPGSIHLLGWKHNRNGLDDLCQNSTPPDLLAANHNEALHVAFAEIVYRLEINKSNA